ncbi:SPX domain-containing membrane protein [Seminavis robusta]|uniref:SPX domain-containing membrane protein n=1 Tax=Seminavis robusta TaxID=568900 RepID=A0A9N8H7T2_9STRA|nr:SPX domain-containing membrane protein [Seminavis robusta]|eukprot:Sro214_g088790.1 SPX domain-containing membrane protein (1577) ;mRNA; f:58446-63631
MVGFGSSLRLARRPGWEEAYLDYEALKLLLTQIEAIYEEEAHLQQRRQDGRDLDVMFYDTPQGHGFTTSTTAVNETEPAGNDYRKELFLESDSDAAFEALMKYDYYSAEEEASELEQQQQLEREHQAAMQAQWQLHMSSQQQQQHNHNNSNTMNNNPASPMAATRQNNNDNSNHNRSSSNTDSIYYTSEQQNSHQHRRGDSNASGPNGAHFSLASYQVSRHQDLYHHPEGYANMDEDDDDDSIDSTPHNNCVPSAWGGGKTKRKPSPKKKNNNNNRGLHFHGKSGGSQFLSPAAENDFFVTAGSNADAFIMDSSSEHQHDDYSTDLMAGPVTPPPPGDNLKHHASTSVAFAAGTATAPASATTSNAAKQALEEERKQERRKRRQKKRQRLAKRKALERKVPRHMRRAHTKARDITERFLGLLRAECEKVMLFAQSRLGELADTCGSLRFPAMEDEHLQASSSQSQSHQYQQHYGDLTSIISSHHHHHSSAEAPLSPTTNSGAARTTPASYDYPLSDGGMHSSASSSSDDAADEDDTGLLFYWSDSSNSDDSVKSRDSASPNVPRSLSAYRDLQQRRKMRSSSKNHHHHHHHAKNESHRSARHNHHNNVVQKHEGFDSAKRHLDHFEKLRRNKPIFQRSGNVMGEDLLLLSAVDEADGYTAVGVELMHVLRFICVNLIAVRKICRKHDRLLMNRMLGGYYHHLKLLAFSESNSKWKENGLRDTQRSFQDEHVQNAQTLGGLLARESADIFEPHHPQVIGQVQNYKLVGLYDANLQQLANSRTVQVISSCLVLALSEYEVSRSRANALATLNTTASGLPAPRRGSSSRDFLRHRQQQQDQMSTMTGGSFAVGGSMGPFDENEEYAMCADSDAPSTASSISLTRLRFTVTSIIALREAARRKQDVYPTYLSRSMLAFTGRAVVGEGLDGCSRETLDFLVSYNPDAALLMDPSSLNDGLKQGMWSKRSMCSVMTSSLAVATTPVELPYALSGRTIRQQAKAVVSAVNILPKFKFVDGPDLFKGQRNKQAISGVALSDYDSFRSILRLNRASNFLYTMNYFCVHPTTITFVLALQQPGVHSALVIGAPNVAALLSALFHCYVLSGDSKEPLARISSLRWLFMLAALFGAVGNAVQVVGFWKNSMLLAVLGRFVMGFSCSSILHRNLVASLLPMNRLVTETAVLVQTQVLGQLTGLLVGTLAEYLPYHIRGWGVKSLSSSTWLMAFCWFMQFLCVCINFKVEDSEEQEKLEANNAAEVEQMLARYTTTNNPQPPEMKQQQQHHDSDSSTSGQGKSHSSGHRTSLQLTYGTGTAEEPIQDDPKDTSLDEMSPLRKKKKRKGRRRRRTLMSFPSRLKRLLAYSVAVPLCFFMVLYIKFAQEVIFSSSAIILNRYFSWGGGRAGIFLSGLTIAVLPMNYICGHIAQKYEERTVIKKSLIVLFVGLLIMLNYGSIVKLGFQLESLFTETEERKAETLYDWLIGIVQYFVGCTVTILALTSLDSSTLSLLSKVSPPRIRSSSVALQLGTIVTFCTLAARLIADVQIVMIGLSHRLINTDLVNSLAMPLLLVCIIIAHLVRKHFFFLM